MSLLDIINTIGTKVNEIIDYLFEVQDTIGSDNIEDSLSGRIYILEQQIQNIELNNCSYSNIIEWEGDILEWEDNPTENNEINEW